MTLDTKKTKSIQKEMITACIQLADLGFLAGIGGNLAVRVDETYMVVTPSASDYYTMKPEDLCVLRIDSLEMVEGTKQPTTESGIHASFFIKRPDINVSLHTHQPLASAITLLGKDLVLTEKETKERLGDRLVMVSYAPSGTSFLVSAFQSKISDNTNGYLLKNHGIVCGAKDLKSAIRSVTLIEKEASEFLRQSIQNHPNPNRLSSRLLKQINTIFLSARHT
ncbi:class II aldolase/adducin family protein [Leptospira paudalimensis]|uniref:Class II aldolase/adducin family protein n=1 Tax=Leptospira paudalimensis TaxID=2950024 RepID=A0ABT3M781_9LEPT|nr:class II aldolase/adducin family protein [Leptospira paudalimensis]MCW7504252.1 class II aldolase/adducin family protein [Leptospira paudalimensis]